MVLPDSRSERRRHSGKFWLLFAFLLLLLITLVVPPLINVNRYRHRISETISNSIGRTVHISGVKLHLLPVPGFELSGVTVYEDPAFGAEPALRSASVVATIRLTSLWRGHLEIARISLDEPSINLARNAEGRWSISSVMLQTARLGNAPTGQRRAGGSSRFPYIEANNARINFKRGVEKLPFSFLNADVSLWLENPGEWRIRLEGQPARTDLVLHPSDTGTLRVEGSLKQAASIGQMPINLEARWFNAPLGQLARLLTGTDTGWRGALDLRSNLKGTLDEIALQSRLRVANVHRVEFSPLEPVNVDTNCHAIYRKSEQSLSAISCLSPIGDGQIAVSGALHTLAHPVPELVFDFKQAPASVLLELLRVVRHGYALSTRVRGAINGHLSYARGVTARDAVIAGEGSISDLSLSSEDMDQPLAIPTVHFSSAAAVGTRHHGRAAAQMQPQVLVFDPVTLPLGAGQPLVLRGDLSADGFELRIAGQSSLARLLPLTRGLGLLRPQLAALTAQGNADLDLSLHGPWLAPLPATVAAATDPLPNANGTILEGTIRLRNGRLTPSFLNAPVDLVSAQGVLAADRIAWSNVSLVFEKMHLDGSISYPLHCMNAPCARHFDVHTAALDAAALHNALKGEHGELVSAILTRIDKPAPWPPLSGTVRVDSFSLGPLTVRNASASVEIGEERVDLRGLDGTLAGGALHATAFFTGTGPAYTIDATCMHASPAELARALGESWGSGLANLQVKLRLEGSTETALADSARGSFSWEWSHGSLPTDDEAESPLARFDNWKASGTVRNRTLVFDRSTLEHAGAALPLSGSIGFDRHLALKSTSSETPLTIGGTLEHSHVEGSDESKQASLPSP